MVNNFRNNTVSTVMEDRSVEIRAKTRIRAGEEITNQYMVPDTPTYLRSVNIVSRHSLTVSSYRRPLMRQKWFFDCGCPRCVDPGELGTHFGSLLCQRGQGGGSRVCGGAVVSTDTRHIVRSASLG